MNVGMVAALSLGACLISVTGAVAGERPGGFNGAWSVQFVTESGICDRSLNYGILVDKGQVYATGGTTFSGRIGSDGHVNLSVYRSGAKADVLGRLRGGSGSGTWQVSSVGCSGHWTAQRQAAVADRSS